MSSFLLNTRRYGAHDPRRIKTALLVYGLDVGDPNKPQREDVFAAGVKSLTAFVEPYGVRLVPIRTTARVLNPDWRFYERQHFGPLLAGIGHALAGGLNSCEVALDNRADYADPWGSHPWLNSYLSSSGLTVRSTVGHLTRVDKCEIVGSDSAALATLRVCHSMADVPVDGLNCGPCAKCVRTRVELLANGVLDAAPAPLDTPIEIEELSLLAPRHAHDLEFLTGPLDRLRGRGHLRIADELALMASVPVGGRRTFHRRLVSKLTRTLRRRRR